MTGETTVGLDKLTEWRAMCSYISGYVEAMSHFLEDRAAGAASELYDLFSALEGEIKDAAEGGGHDGDD